MTINLDRGLNDLEDSIDRLIKQKEYLQKQLRKTKDRSEEIIEFLEIDNKDQQLLKKITVAEFK